MGHMILLLSSLFKNLNWWKQDGMQSKQNNSVVRYKKICPKTLVYPNLQPQVLRCD